MTKPCITDATKGTVPLKKLKIVLQQKSSLCGPAAMRILLSYFKIDRKESYLARLCKSTEKKGTHPRMIVAALKKLGFEVKSGTWGSSQKCWDTLNYWINNKNLPVLVDWFSETDGHYSVAFRLSKNNIWLADPEPKLKIERVKKISWDVFMRLWHDFEGEYPRQPQDFEVRWWLVAYPAPLRLLLQR